MKQIKYVIREEQIQYAKDNYPIGTKYKCATGDGLTHTIVGDRTTYKIVGHQVWGDKGKGCLFNNGKWAEIVLLLKQYNYYY